MTRLAAHLARCLPTLADPRTDGDLLTAFLYHRDEPAFAELVRRHGPLVWAACRRLLPDPADAEDAFQATFLVLVRRARRLTGEAVLGPWLYRVAALTARNVRRRNARTLARRLPLSPVAADPSPGPEAFDLRDDLDRALLALPEKYRTPLVLCHLQGWSRRDAAERLGCPEGTLSARLSRGLARLRAELRDRDPSRALTAGAVAVPAVLASATVTAAAASRLAVAGVISSSVSQLVEGVIHMFWVKKATAATCALVVVFGMGVGVGVSVREGPPVLAVGDGPPVATGQPSAGPTTAFATPDAALIKLLDELNAQLLAAEVVIRHAQDGVALTKQKVDISKKAWENKTGSFVSYLQDMITLTRFEENVAAAEQKQAEIRDKIAEVKTKLKAAKAAPPRPAPRPAPQPPADPDALDKLSTDLLRLEREIELVRIERAGLEGKIKALQLEREQLRLKIDELKNPPVPGGAKPPAEAAPAKACIGLRIDPKDQWQFTVSEYDADGKSAGTVGFRNVEALRRFLVRTANDPVAPKDVRLITRRGTPKEDVQAVVEACKAAGLTISAGADGPGSPPAPSQP